MEDKRNYLMLEIKKHRIENYPTIKKVIFIRCVVNL